MEIKGLKTYWRTLLLAALFIVVLLVVMKRRSADDGFHLWDLQPEQITAIAVRNQESQFNLTFTDGRWSWQDKDQSIPLDDEKFKWRLATLLHPHVESRLELEDKTQGLAKRYGLEPSQGELVMMEKSGLDHRLLIGNRTPLQRHYYVRLPGETAILLLPVSSLAPLIEMQLQDVAVAETTESPARIPEEESLLPEQSPPQ